MGRAQRLYLDRKTWLTIRRLYLQKWLTPTAIAVDLNIPEDQIPLLRRQMCNRGLPAEKRRRESLTIQRNALALNKQDDDDQEKAEAWKEQSEELLEHSFGMGRDAANGKELQACANASRAYLDVYKTAKEISLPLGQGGKLSGLNIFFVKECVALPPKEMKTAEVIEVQGVNEGEGIF